MRRLVDGALQGAALIAGGASTNAEMRGVETEGRQQPGFGGRNEAGGSGPGKQMAAVQFHAGGILRPRRLTPC